MPLDQRDLGEEEQAVEAENAIDPKGDPHLVRGDMAHRFIEDPDGDHEKPQPQGELTPTLIIHVQHLAKGNFQERLAECQTGEQEGPAQGIGDGDLDLDEFLITQKQGEAAENQHENQRNRGQHRDLPRQGPGDREGNETGNQQGPGGDKNIGHLIDHEKQEEGPDIN